MIDRETLLDRLSAIGEALDRPAKICLIGSGATLFAGQDSRQTPDIDVWRPSSDFDLMAFRKACLSAGLLFDPTGHVPDGVEYIQLIREGVVSLPHDFPIGSKETFGNLEVFIPPLSLIAALKLARGSESDLADAAWIVKSQAVSLSEIKDWSNAIPNQQLSETSLDNIVILELILSQDHDDGCRP
jgi:hypothetical protein